MENLDQITQLLDRYWEGESSLEDERRLKAYFNSGSVDPSLRRFEPLFKALKAEQAVHYAKTAALAPMSASPVKRRYFSAAAAVALLLAAGAWYFNQSTPGNTIANTEQQQPEKVENPVRVETKSLEQPDKLVQAETKTNGPKLIKKRQNKPKQEEISSEEAEKAWLEVKAALALVSSKINKGKKEAVKGAEHLDLDKHLKIKSAG
jgi:hypothetical protein